VHLARASRVPTARLFSEAGVVIRRSGTDLIQYDAQKMLKEFLGGLVSDGKSVRPVNGYGELQFAFRSLNLWNFKLNEPDQAAHEAVSFGLVALNVSCRAVSCRGNIGAALSAVKRGLACKAQKKSSDGSKVCQRKAITPACSFPSGARVCSSMPVS